jgi:NADH-quinone oxidoreductase subunit N
VQRGQWTLAVIGVLTSVIGAVYYLRVIKVMYFDAPAEPFEARATATSVLVFGCALFTALFFLFPGAIVASADAAARSLF